MTRIPLAAIFAICLALPSPAVMAAAPAMKPFGGESWQALRAAYKGKPLIVHFWSIACAPCVAELPKWAAFLKAHPDAPVVLVDWDKPGDDRNIAERLDEMGLSAADNWTLDEDFEQKLRFHIDRGWMGELPRTELIARDGSMTAVSGAINLPVLAKWLQTQTE